ncbi:hypothetical protein MES4922_380031 [Mesorhizobium ventifaucium]|uniref:Uncharacterized protein n=1 Tax=Mesorhizobium ventifaucium TaxID=666020 RepID=A0ABN8K3Q3_9HYPH|nr:hypothetical protein MES4922_380031 [Mesorhizobium ventifaucium]
MSRALAGGRKPCAYETGWRCGSIWRQATEPTKPSGEQTAIARAHHWNPPLGDNTPQSQFPPLDWLVGRHDSLDPMI